MGKLVVPVLLLVSFMPAVAGPGANGSCGMTARSIDNPRRAEGTAPPPVWIYEPSGSGAAEIAGGHCGETLRPAVFVAHGFGQTDPVSYEELIEHLVSVGNVVVYPVYSVDDGSRRTLEESFRVVDAGIAAAVAATPRIDTTRVGWWGHSHGGGMIPYLVQQGSARGWGNNALWMSMVAQTYTQLVGTADIPVPNHAQAMTVAFDGDAFADARLGIDVFESLQLPFSQKRHVTLRTDVMGVPPLLAEHGAPAGADGQADAADAVLWRYSDLLETCALAGQECDADLSFTGRRPNGRPFEPALVTERPRDVGPYPAILAECDAGFGPRLNPRIERCGRTRI